MLRRFGVVAGCAYGRKDGHSIEGLQGEVRVRGSAQALHHNNGLSRIVTAGPFVAERVYRVTARLKIAIMVQRRGMRAR